MKNKILLGVALLCVCLFSQNMYAQLKVNSSGNVQVQNKFSITPDSFSDDDTAVTVISTAAMAKSACGIYSKVFYPRRPYGYAALFANKVIGVHGYTEYNFITPNYNSAYPFNAGVAGTSDHGVGVYGAITDTFPTYNPGQYAGYFLGNTKVIGVLSCTSLTQTSDASTKNNIQYLRENALDNIMQLKPISFYYNLDDRLFNAEDTKSPAAQQKHYGFMAQELKEVLPDIVYMGQDSLLSINYLEIIPLLVKSIQNQQKRITDLEHRITEYEASRDNVSTPSNMAPNRNSGNAVVEYALYQNTPNPFTQDTYIAYKLPLDTHDAMLYVYDVNGVQLESHPITEFGANGVTISGGHLQAGMYLYSLIADGQIVDTKRMILTK